MQRHPHEVKKQKKDQQQHKEYNELPSVACLFTASAGLPEQPSPAAVHGCRIAALVRFVFFCVHILSHYALGLIRQPVL